MKKSQLVIAMLAILSLTACGTTESERGVSGAGIGAGAGAVGALLLDANPWAGALIGAGAGAITGVATTHN